MPTPQQPITTPTPEQVAQTAERVEFLWNLVPRSARPLHRKIKDDVDRSLTHLARFLETRGLQLQAAVALASAAHGDATSGSVGADNVNGTEEGANGEEEAAPLPIIMRMLRLLSPEQTLQVRILLELRKLSDEGRREVFDELAVSHHLECGGELDPDGGPHECEDLDVDDDGDGDDDDGDDGDDGDNAADTRAASGPLAPPVLGSEVISTPTSSEEPR